MPRRLRWIPGSAILLIVVFTAVDARAQSLDVLTSREWFDALDENTDDLISSSEITRLGLFSLLDSDANGELSFEELAILREAGLARETAGQSAPWKKLQFQGFFKRLDRDSSGQLSTDELLPLLDAVTATSEDSLDAASDEAAFVTPELLIAGQFGIGQRISDFPFESIEGNSSSLNDYAQEAGDADGATILVIAVTDPTCPLSKRYAPVLARLEAQYADRDVAFLFINVNESASLEEMRASVEAHGLKGPYINDADGHIRNALGVQSTAEVFVVDRANTLLYRGAVDDQYGVGYTPADSPQKTFLIDALEATLIGKRPLATATSAPGCFIDSEPDWEANKEVTYHNRISRVVQTNCLECHRSGGLAPFALETQEQVEAKAAMIRFVIKRGIMPPWNASPAGDGTRTRWLNDRTLAQADRDDLLAWLASDRPTGDPAHAPIDPSFESRWKIDEPDIIVELPKPIRVKAEGVMPYVHRKVPTDFGEDKWITGVEIQPTAREQVHHMNVWPLPESEDVEVAENVLFDGLSREGAIASYIPGNDHIIYPPSTGRLLPRGTTLYFQYHFAPNGQPASEQTELGFNFLDEPPEFELRSERIGNANILIPAYASDHREEASRTLLQPITLTAVTPHMHIRGRAFRVDVILPGEKRKTLLRVPRYDFNWQHSYRLFEPLYLPAGTEIIATGWWDNGADNPANPDASADVSWGPQTDDEMLICRIEYIVDN